MSASDWPVEVDPTWGCWNWCDRLDRDGYGIVFRGGRPVKAYLVVYTAEVGPIPDGMVADHRCRVRLCVSPLHMLITSQSNNLVRRKWSTRVRQPLCDAGHGSEHAMVNEHGGRLCRLCHRGGE